MPIIAKRHIVTEGNVEASMARGWGIWTQLSGAGCSCAFPESSPHGCQSPYTRTSTHPHGSNEAQTARGRFITAPERGNGDSKHGLHVACGRSTLDRFQRHHLMLVIAQARSCSVPNGRNRFAAVQDCLVVRRASSRASVYNSVSSSSWA
jgi:hypothetical protein